MKATEVSKTIDAAIIGKWHFRICYRVDYGRIGGGVFEVMFVKVLRRPLEGEGFRKSDYKGFIFSKEIRPRYWGFSHNFKQHD